MPGESSQEDQKLPSQLSSDHKVGISTLEKQIMALPPVATEEWHRFLSPRGEEAIRTENSEALPKGTNFIWKGMGKFRTKELWRKWKISW